TEATAVAERRAELEDRLAQAEARAASAEDARRQAEAQAVEAVERAKVAEGLLGEAEALLVEAEAEFRRAREGEVAPAAMSATDPDLADPTPAPARVNGVNASAGGRRPTTKVEVDTLVRRLVQESAGRSGRKVSVYAEPVVVLAPHGVIEAIVSDLLERSVQRTSEGNRIVVHVERAADGALLSVEHGRPPEEDALSAETRQLVADLGGWAAVEPHPGGGSILRVLLPRETSDDAAISA
ncbi:MAG TPA: ATP-binding protein, partial [Actinomycetota bacterium]|nr:ATP-binding protein [Actinomycetota bacterium]